MSTNDPEFEDAGARPAADGDDTEAQRASDALKEQIAAVRARVKDARQTLAEHVRRTREGRSFKR